MKARTTVYVILR